ncbi:MAG: phage tail tape measure protein, partial [Candidatus Hecatellales archaeon]
MPVNAEVSMIISAKDQASGALRMVEQRVKALEGTIMRARATMNSLSMGFGKLALVSGAATGALAGAVGMLTKMNISIEDHLRTAQTMFDTTEQGWQDMEKQLEETAVQTGRTLEDLADALYLVGSAGIPAEKAMTVLKQTAIAATAGATDMQTALSSGISIINAYGLQIEDLSRVYALQFETVRKGLMTYEQLATDFGVVAPAAKQLGASLEEALAGYASLTKMGISSAESATATSRAFLDLVSKGEKLKKIGVEIYDKYGQFRGLLPVIDDLRKKLKGTQEEQAALLEEIGFEMRAARAIVNWAAAYETLRDTMEGLRGDTDALVDAYEKQTRSIGFLWR